MRYWDGTSWSGRPRESPPSTPWTSWLALALVLGSMLGQWLVGVLASSGDGIALFRALVATWLIGALLAAADVVRGRRRRLPLGVAVVTLLIWFGVVLWVAAMSLFLAFVMGV